MFETIVNIWNDYTFIVVLILVIGGHQLWTRYLKFRVKFNFNKEQKNFKKKIIIKKKNNNYLTLDEQKNICMNKQKDVKKRLNELELEKKKFLKEAKLNKLHFEYLESIGGLD